MNREVDPSEEFSTSAELRSYIENNLSDENTDVYPHTGLISNPDALELMNFLSNAYDGEQENMPYRFRETKLGEQMRKSEATKTASKAVAEGNISQMKFVSGKQTYDIDATSLHALIQLRDRLSKDAYVQYLFGHMGNGKTDFATLQGELANRELGYEIGSNIKSLKEKDAFIRNYGSLLRWLADGQKVSSIDEIVEKDIDVSDKLLIFDEASSHASGYSNDAYETQKKLGVMVKKIRKVNGRMIVIGHTGKDLHPDIRRLAECAAKVSKKTVEFYNTVTENGEGKGFKDSIGGIPKTNWNSYDTNEITNWDWSEVPKDEQEETSQEIVEQEQSVEERNLEIVTAIIKNEHPDIEPNEKGNITYEMLANHYGLSEPRITQIKQDYVESGKEQMED